VILTILTDARAMEEVYASPDGTLSADVKGKLVIESSTVRSEAQIAMAAKLRAHGAAYVECPVGGTTGPAQQRKLLGLAVGEKADVARAKPILEQLCRRVDHVGPVGAGASMKLAINLPLLVFYQAFGEALTLCQHLGHDPDWLTALFAETSGGPNVLRTRGAAIALALKGGDPRPRTFDVDLIRKDLRTMLDEARARSGDLPLTARALEVYDSASADGWASAMRRRCLPIGLAGQRGGRGSDPVWLLVARLRPCVCAPRSRGWRPRKSRWTCRGASSGKAPTVPCIRPWPCLPS
jgi:3-hydroxyisobutyrate dehydrogenase